MPKCPKCGKEVYFAEQKLAMKHTWHKMCFRCENCGRSLDAAYTEHEDKAYCKNCYGKLFGPKGVGFGVGAGALSMDTGSSTNKVTRENVPATAQAYAAPLSNGGDVKPVSKPKYGSTDICPRCSKTVYFAEKVMGAGKIWHKQCFTCHSCKKRMDSTTVTEREDEIYCKSCYGKQFGPKGIGFGIGAGSLTMGQ